MPSVMSKDRVVFKLPPRYFQRHRSSNSFHRDDMAVVMVHAFNMALTEAYRLFESHPDGPRIACRPAQFGRFIVMRAQVGPGINGVRDLEAKLVPSLEGLSPVGLVASKLRVPPDHVARVLQYLRMEPDDVVCPDAVPFDVDVSNRSRVESDRFYDASFVVDGPF